ncbi:hypothetical protein Droror1_Dr00016449 [Drosera rotundifolia]
MAEEKRFDSTLDRSDESSGEEFEDSSSSSRSEVVVSSGSGGLANRLAGLLVGEGDGDLLLEESDRESVFLRWIQALDTHVVGACRADERLKPMLTVNASSGVAEDQIISHLCQHFKAAEVGLLTRFLCIPLVTMRVGKVIKEGKMLCPTPVRGNLNLTLLPSSDLRISFVGDDGITERIATLSTDLECSAVVIKEITVDKSGRSFLIDVPQATVSYFWCSEKSKLLGIELLSEMKDLLKRKPTLAELTGISETRLEWFASRLRAYLIGANVNASQGSSAASTLSSPSAYASPAASMKPSRSRQAGIQSLSVLAPRTNSFKDSNRTFSSLRGASIEKLLHFGDVHLPSSAASTFTLVGEHSENVESDNLGSTLDFPRSFLESLEKSSSSAILSTSSQHPTIEHQFSPYYCRCPPPSLPARVPSPHFPISIAEPLSLPPLSSLLPATRSASLLTQSMPFDLSGISTLLPDPLLQIPFSRQSSQQLPTFTPLMCDPIVHIPVIDVCSSGQGYLVSAGSAVSTSIAPLHPKLVSPLISESETAVEKGARETLRLLIGGSSQSTALMDMLPAVLTSNGSVAGSRGLYSGTTDIDAMSRCSFSGVVTFPVRSTAVGSRGLYSGTSYIDDTSRSFSARFVPFSERSIGVGDMKTCSSVGSLDSGVGLLVNNVDDGCSDIPDPASSSCDTTED